MILYSKAFPALDVAVMVMVPSEIPQSVGFVDATAEIVGKTGSVKTTVCPNTSHVPSAFLTRISFGLSLAFKPLNTFDNCHVEPPSLLYS